MLINTCHEHAVRIIMVIHQGINRYYNMGQFSWTQTQHIYIAKLAKFMLPFIQICNFIMDHPTISACAFFCRVHYQKHYINLPLLLNAFWKLKNPYSPISYFLRSMYYINSKLIPLIHDRRSLYVLNWIV